MALDPEYGYELIGQVYEKDTDDRLFSVWNQEHVAEMVFNGGKFTPFEDYKKACYEAAEKQQKPKLTAKEIIAKAEKIKRADQHRG